jgi:hypothetical protein
MPLPPTLSQPALPNSDHPAHHSAATPSTTRLPVSILAVVHAAHSITHDSQIHTPAPTLFCTVVILPCLSLCPFHPLPAQAQAAALRNTYTLNLPAQPPIRPTRPPLRPLNRSTKTCMYLLLPQEEIYICSSRLGLIKLDHHHSGNGRNSQQ